jgi:hypothetical protein
MNNPGTVAAAAGGEVEIGGAQAMARLLTLVPL